MAKSNPIIDSAISQEYEYGFVTDIEQETIPPGLNEDVIRLISSKKNEPDWLLKWRLKAYGHWLKMKEPNWAKLHYAELTSRLFHIILHQRKKKNSKVWMK